MNIIKELQNLKCKVANLFSNLTETQAKQISNAINNIMTQQYGSKKFNIGSDYSSGNYGFGYIYPNGGNRNFKLIVEYI